jgi:hypothetical protein
METYLTRLFEITSNAALNDEDKIGAQAIEFWTSLAEEEYSRLTSNKLSSNYIPRACELLSDLLLKGIQKINFEDDEEEESQLGVATSSGCCLAAISLIVGDTILQKVFDFVGANLEN